MSKLGKLNASLLVDGGVRPHYGAGDPITGRLVLRYNPATALFKKDPVTADLFGPIRINVVLVGHIQIKVRRDRDLPTHHTTTLFAQPFHVYDGSSKAQVNCDYTFPFQAHFPDQTTHIMGRDAGTCPPTFGMHFSDYPDIIDVSVMYQLGAKVEMQGIDIKITLPEGHSAPQVRFDMDRLPQSYFESQRSVFSERVTVQNEYLLPEHLRPTGFKQKARAVFSSSQFPVFTAEVYCTDPRSIFPGEQLTFDIRLVRNDAKCSSIDDDFWPTRTLESFQADLKAYTTVDASHRIIGKSACFDSRTVQNLRTMAVFPLEFHKEWSIKVQTGPVGNHPSSFEHMKVQRVYRLKIIVQLRIANQKIKIVRECPVTVCPSPREAAVVGEKLPMPMEEHPPPPSIEAGPSGTRDDGEELPPPRYEESGSSKLLKSG